MTRIFSAFIVFMILFASATAMAKDKSSLTRLRKEFLKEIFSEETPALPVKAAKPTTKPTTKVPKELAAVVGTATPSAPIWPLVVLAPGLALAIFLIKRGSKARTGKGAISKLASMPLGNKSSLALVDVLGQKVVLGITEKGINLLLRLPDESFQQEERHDKETLDFDQHSFDESLSQTLAETEDPIFISQAYASGEGRALANKLGHLIS